MLKLEAKIKYDQYGNITIYSPDQVTISATNGINLGSQGTLSLSSIFQSNDTGSFSASGGSDADTGNNTISYGSSHATLAGDYKIRYNTTDVFHYDHSGGLFDFTDKIVVDAPKIYRSVNSDMQSISGGNSDDTGANIELYGGTHATLAGDVKIRFDTTDVFHYDHSASTYDFKTKALIGVNSVSVGSDASVVKYSGGTSNVLGGIIELYGENHATKAGDVDIKSSASDIINYDHSAGTIDVNGHDLIGVDNIFNELDNSLTAIYGGSATTSSAIFLYGVSHATKANDIELKSGATTVLHYDDSASLIDAQNNELRTTATATVGSITFGSSGPQDLKGTGDPEGVITAVQGSTFRRTDGASGTTFYNKISGSGNTGWEAVGTGAGVSWTSLYSATPSGTTVNVSGIPAGANEVLIDFNGITISGAGTINVRLGDSGGIEITGYSGRLLARRRQAANDIDEIVSTPSGEFTTNAYGSTSARYGVGRLTKTGTNKWVFDMEVVVTTSDTEKVSIRQEKTLTGDLSQIDFISSSGSFNGGTLTVQYR